MDVHRHTLTFMGFLSHMEQDCLCILHCFQTKPLPACLLMGS